MAARFLGHRRGGLAYASVAGCAGFGSINGSSLATTATIGLVALPEMRSRGYSDALATGSVAAGGTLGQMIPPSGALIVYGIIAEQSIGSLFTAAIIPGITQMLSYMLVIALLVWWRPRHRAGAAARELGGTVLRAEGHGRHRPAGGGGHRRHRDGLDHALRGGRRGRGGRLRSSA